MKNLVGAAFAVSLLFVCSCAPAPPPVTVAPLPTPAPGKASRTAPSADAAAVQQPKEPAAPKEVPFPDVPAPIDIAIQTNVTGYSLPAGEWLVRSGSFNGRLTGPVTVSAASEAAIIIAAKEGTAEIRNLVEFASPCGNPVPIGDGIYRGNIVVRSNARGTLHVINRVSLEDYLKGVVPSEMGPRVYDELEALKAQAVAARSYAIRHRGESAAKGYDLCGTPKCQVYGGVGAEHPLSSRAVEATTGEVVIWSEEVADTLFTSTCGGQTEAASDVFPSYSREEYPYLVAVKCAGESPIPFRTSLPPGRPATPLGVRGRALLASLGRAGAAFQDVIAARSALRERLGLSPGGGPRTLQPAAVYADLERAAQFGETSLLTSPEEWNLAPAGWPREARAGYVLALRFQLGGATALPVDRPFTHEEVAGLYAGLVSRTGDLDEVDGRLVASDGKTITVRNGKGKTSYPLLDHYALYTGTGDRYLPEALARPFAGDRVKLFVRGGQVVCLAFALTPAAGLYERDSAWIHWTRRFSGAELMAKLRERDAARPGSVVRKVEVLERGTSGRARKVRLTTDAGPVLLVGLEIRFALGLPESLFTFVAGKDRSGPIFTFYGRGWGHGVGLCQNGAYGEALAGKSYRDILGHYYPGTSVGQASSLAGR